MTTEPSRKAMKDATIATYSTRFSTLDMAAAGVPDMAAAFLTARLGAGTGFGLSLAPEHRRLPVSPGPVKLQDGYET